MTYEGQFLRALAATVAVETLVLWIAVRWLLPAAERPGTGRVLGAGALCSGATLPYLWFVLPAFISSHALLLGIGEPSVTVAEGCILATMLPTRFSRGMALSVVCNGLSWGAGALFLR